VKDIWFGLFSNDIRFNRSSNAILEVDSKMAKIIFKQLEEATITVRNRLHSQLLVDKEAKQLEEQKYAALMEIVAYVRKMDFLSHASGKEKLHFFFKSHFNYKQTADHINCPLNNIESAVSYAGKQLERRIGKETIRMIVQAQNQEALDATLLQFRIGSNPSSNQKLFLCDLSKWFPKPENMGCISLDEFNMEFRMLHVYSLSLFQAFLDSADLKRLSHLLYILQSTDHIHAMERQVLVRMLKGEYRNYEEAWEAWAALQGDNLFAPKDEELILS
jgi:hypothetical protein